MKAEVEVTYTDNPSRPPEEFLDPNRCFVNPDIGVAFWAIEKCGFTSLSAALQGHGFRRSSDPIDSCPIHFTVLREPYRRYVAGLATIHRLDYVADVAWSPYIVGVRKYIKRKGTVWTCNGNQHFRRQAVVTKRMPEGSRVFRLEQISELELWLKKFGVEVKIPHLNKTALEKRIRAGETLKPVQSVILDYYSDDYDLWAETVWTI